MASSALRYAPSRRNKLGQRGGIGTRRTGYERLGKQEDGDDEGDNADADGPEGTPALEHLRQPCRLGTY